MKPVVSRVTIKIGGDVVLNREGFTFRKGGIQRETVMGDAGVHGFTERPIAARLSGNVTARQDSELDQYDVSDATVLVKCNDGKSYVMRNACRTDVPEMNTGEGQYTLTLEGPAAELM